MITLSLVSKCFSIKSKTLFLLSLLMVLASCAENDFSDCKEANLGVLNETTKIEVVDLEAMNSWRVLHPEIIALHIENPQAGKNLEQEILRKFTIVTDNLEIINSVTNYLLRTYKKNWHLSPFTEISKSMRVTFYQGDKIAKRVGIGKNFIISSGCGKNLLSNSKHQEWKKHSFYKDIKTILESNSN